MILPGVALHARRGFGVALSSNADANGHVCIFTVICLAGLRRDVFAIPPARFIAVVAHGVEAGPLHATTTARTLLTEIIVYEDVLECLLIHVCRAFKAASEQLKCGPAVPLELVLEARRAGNERAGANLEEIALLSVEGAQLGVHADSRCGLRWTQCCARGPIRRVVIERVAACSSLKDKRVLWSLAISGGRAIPVVAIFRLNVGFACCTAVAGINLSFALPVVCGLPT